MAVHELDHAVLLTVERSVEALEGRLDKYLEDGDEVTTGQLTELSADVRDLRDRITELERDVATLQTALDKTLEIIKDMLAGLAAPPRPETKTERDARRYDEIFGRDQ